jgi:hypothetical protein
MRNKIEENLLYFVEIVFNTDAFKSERALHCLVHLHETNCDFDRAAAQNPEPRV